MFSETQDRKDRVACLLLKGHEYSHTPLVTDENMAISAIDLITSVAENEPGFLIGQLILFPNSHLAPVALAILVCKASSEFLQDKYNKDGLSEVLLAQNPDQLLEFVKYVKSKVFGKGLGSYSQKLIRKILESWPNSILIEFSKNYPKSTYALIRLIHPRFKGSKGEIIQKLLNKPPK